MLSHDQPILQCLMLQSKQLDIRPATYGTHGHTVLEDIYALFLLSQEVLNLKKTIEN